MRNVYTGTRKRGGPEVLVNGRPLPSRNDLIDHSPDGFEWGYGGSGPAQLALAILAYEFGDQFALRYYQDFKWKIIANLRPSGWFLTSDGLRRILADCEIPFDCERGKSDV